ncbi:MAG: hypothetical protein GY886_08490 [Gammaproteobacteria bacterium]|nr:hypothetical protein [Gammaproteobacteria bacterium]MCP4832232.1 hypothetical protein [Gammaproteobacteria bacterium]
MLGFNINATVQNALPPVTCLFYEYTGGETKPNGLVSQGFADPFEFQANVHAVDRSVYGVLGLQADKDYIEVFCNTQLKDSGRGRASDQIAYNGRRYNINQETDWYKMDGWNSAIFIDIGINNAPS